VTAPTTLQAGERILLQARSGRKTFLVELTPGRTLHTHDGVIKHDDVIGRPEGSAILSHMQMPFVAVRPTLVQKMMKVKRRTQIIYPKDAARIALELSIAPGARVIEMGGGSGALTLLMATLVRPDGRIYSYDRNAEFQEVAKENVSKAGLAAFVEFFVLEAGQPFGQSDVDAVVLDMPEPWLAIRPAHESLRLGGALGLIIPNAEQLKAAQGAAESAGFQDLTALEILERRMLVRQKEGVRPSERMIGFTGYLLFGRKY